MLTVDIGKGAVDTQPLFRGYTPNLDLNELRLDVDYRHPLLPTGNVVVPCGYTTDGASIPRGFRWILGQPFWPRFQLATLLHDYLYTYTYGKRADADWLMFLLLHQNGVGEMRCNVMYRGVRFGGGFAWRSNAYENDRRANALLGSLPIHEIHSR